MTGAGARGAARDLMAGASRRWLWTALGWHDVVQRYRGSLLGPFWITINIVLMVGCLTLIFADPLGSDRRGYAPYVAVGLVLWYFIQATLNEACQVFVSAAETIRHTSMPLSVHVLRLLWRNTLVLGHNLLLVPVVLIVFGVGMGTSIWMAIPALALLLFSIFCVSLLLGLLGARFRDVPQVVTNLLQLLFFMTPIFWPGSALDGPRALLVHMNPVFAFIDIVRSPLIGAAPAALSWPVALATGAAAAALSFLALSRMRSRVAYWI